MFNFLLEVTINYAISQTSISVKDFCEDSFSKEMFKSGAFRDWIIWRSLVFAYQKKRSEIRRTPPARLSFPMKIRLFSSCAACLEEAARRSLTREERDIINKRCHHHTTTRQNTEEWSFWIWMTLFSNILSNKNIKYIYKSRLISKCWSFI